MRIGEMTIHNYRSIKHLNMRCRPSVVMLGPNNHGKSNILSAIEFTLSTSAKPREDDFFEFREREDDELWTEITFEELTEQELITFKRYVREDGTVRIRKFARFNDGAVETGYRGYIQQPTDWWLQNTDETISRLKTRSEVNETPLKDLVPASGQISKAAIKEAQERFIREKADKLEFIEELEQTPLLGQKNVGGGVLPDFYIIPAVRDLADETKIKTTTAFGRLLNRAIQEMAASDPKFEEIKKNLEELIDALSGGTDTDTIQGPVAELEENLTTELSHWGVSVAIEVTPPAIEKVFELGTTLLLDDGHRTLAEKKGMACNAH